MNGPRCPGQDIRRLKPEDVFNVPCPRCKSEVEFFKDDSSLKCPSCGAKVHNPKIDLGCATWCAFAEQCLGETPAGIESLRDRLDANARKETS